MKVRTGSAALWVLATAALCAWPQAGPADDGKLKAGADPVRFYPSPKPRRVAAPRAEDLEKAITRGVDFLIGRQNKDGSWGSARRTKGGNIYAPVPGAHHAFRTGTTGLCISALIEAGDSRAEAAGALERAEGWLVANLPRLRRAAPRAIYNNWGHAYAIQALVRLIRRGPEEEKRRARLVKLIEGQIDRLCRYETVSGGWGYYDFGYRFQRPGGGQTSFTTATVLVALHEARQLGVKVPQRLIDRGVATLRRQRKPDFSYGYSESVRWRPMAGINRPAGSLGRSQVCNLALRLWGDEKITDQVLKTWLDRLAARGGWLDMGRKRPIPHESWFEVAGYFFYYGHYYAGMCVEQLPAEDRPPFQAQLANIVLGLQEKDGSWWDFPLYDYHQQYGTAMALMTLHRCRRPAGGKPKTTPGR